MSVAVRRAINIGLAMILTATMVWVPLPAQAAKPLVDHVVIVGVPGLRWVDVDKENTPTLWRLSEEGGIGNMSVRAAAAMTCPADGWVTMGAGNRARGPEPRARYCPQEFPIAEPIPGGDGSFRLAEQSQIADDNNELNHGARPGMLASSVRCTSAVGRGAAVAAARTNGRVENYTPTTPGDLQEYLRRCEISVVEVPQISGEFRKELAHDADAQIAAIEAALPERTMLMIAGVADLTGPPALHAMIIKAPGFEHTWLTSSSTRRQPYVQLIDVAPTALKALDVGAPKAIVGQPMTAGERRSRSTDVAIDGLEDAQDAAAAQRPLVPEFYSILVTANLILLAAGAVYFRRRSRRVGETLPDPAAGHSGRPHLLGSLREHRVARGLEIAAIGVAALPVSAFLANLFPWWRAHEPRIVLFSIIAMLSVVIAVIALQGPWRRHSLGPPAVIGLLTGFVLGADVVAGSHLELNSMLGYSPLVAGRFTGFGNYGFAIFAGGVILGAAYVAQLLDGWRRLGFLIGLGLIVVIVDGAPIWGSDVGGIIALTPAFIILAMRASGVWLSPLRILGSLAAGLVAVAIFGWVDYLRPETERTHLGRFVAQMLDGTAGTIVQRKAEANVNLLVSSQLTILVIAVVLFVPLILLPRSAGLRRVFGLFPCVKAGAIGILIAALVGFAVNDSGIAIPAFMSAVVIPLAIATILRVLASSTRSVASTQLGPPRVPSVEPGGGPP